MAPDRTAVQQLPGQPPQTVDERLCGVKGEADQVDHGIRLQVGDAGGEAAVAILRDAIGSHVLHPLPGGVVDVAGALPAADVDDVVPGADQPRDEESADVAAATDDDDSHGSQAGRSRRPVVSRPPGRGARRLIATVLVRPITALEENA